MQVRVYIIAMLIVVIGCSKDPSITDGSVCYDFPTTQGPTICYLYSEGQYQFKAPCFNPNNQDEFCYVFINHNTNVSKLMRYSLTSKESSTMVEGFSILGQPKWTKKNWIVFNTLDHQLWKVKSNGDSLIQLTFEGSSLYPEINPQGTIIASHHQTSTQELPFLHFINDNGFSIDTIDYFKYGNGSWGVTSWSKNDELALPYGSEADYGVASFNLISESLDPIISNGYHSGKDKIVDIKWHPNSQDIYYTKWKSGFYTINIFSKQEQLLKEGCDSRAYEHFSISQDGLKIITERVNSYVEDECTIIQNSKIYLMNINGLEEVEIELPLE